MDTPIGVVLFTAQTDTADPPPGWMFCNGQSLNVNTYQTLFSVIGYTYGGSGENFSLPDLRGRVVVHRDSTDSDFDVINEKRGSKTHTLSTGEIPSHTHLIGSTVTGGTSADSVLRSTDQASHDAVATQPAGTGGSHNNIQPSIVLQAIIKVF